MTRWLAGLRVALRALVGRRRVEAELDEEIRYHMEREIGERLDAGLDPDEARYAALRAMGPVARHKEEVLDLRSGRLIVEFLGDLRYAGRTLIRRPGFTLLAIVVMALGIGANAAVFSVVNGVLLKPLPYPGADRIVTLSTANLVTSQVNPLVTIANFRDWREASASFDAMATYRGGEAPVTPGEAAEYARHANVDQQFFRVFGVEPILGQTFSLDDAAPDTDRLTAIISHAYWQARFAEDAAILQRTIRVGESTRAIIGVMPPGFHFPGRTDVWTPQPNRSGSRTSHSFFAVARLKPRVTLAAAQSELSTVAARLEQQYPDSNKGRGVAAAPLQAVLVGDVRSTLYLLWGVVAVVLLIACANTATLLLGKATARRREIAVRTALGASRLRILRQLVTESLLLALLAGATGVVLAAWGVRGLVALAPADVIRLTDTRIDTGVLLFTLVVSIATSLLFGLVPAFHASRVDLTEAFRYGSSGAMTGGRLIRARGVLVVAEIALAVVLVIGAGLLIKSLAALQNVELGFRPENVLVMRATGIRGADENNAYFRDVMSRIGAIPGVLAVGATSIPPGDLSNAGDGGYAIDRVPEQRDRAREPHALYTMVAPGTFSALGVPLRRGRDFSASDMAESPLVAIVNEALVRRSFGAEDPIGRTIICFFDRKGPMTIVGVVGDVRQRNPGIEPIPECYMPYTQHNYNANTLHVVARTAGDSTALAGTVRRLSAEIAPHVPVSFTTMEATISKGIERARFRALLLAIFAGLAVCLAMAGVYGVMAHTVGQRSKEIGLRIALGASQGSVLRMVLGQGLTLAAAGLVLGLAAAAGATRLLETMLFAVRPVDAIVYLGVAVLLAGVTLVAGYLPARRAAVVDPVQVLKAD
jgi:predicted permease